MSYIIFIFHLNMNQEKQYHHDFLSVIQSQKPPINPFKIFSNLKKNDSILEYNYYGFTEDLYDFEIRCPICLARVKLARRPDSCFHIFCFDCLENWCRQCKKCPYCRKSFSDILKVSYSESWVREKYA